MIMKASGFAGRSVRVKDRDYLYFGGTAYLGIPQNKEFLGYLNEGMEKYGTNYGSSRNSNLQLDIFDLAESKLAAACGAEAALTMSSGFMACQLVVRALQGKGKLIYAPDTHPALWLQEDSFFSGDYTAWAENMLQQVAETREKQIVIISNAVDALRASRIHFSWISCLPKDKECTVVLDDSHGLGITGTNGGGIFGQLPKNPAVNLIVVSSLGKAMGLPGGVVLSSDSTVRSLKSSPYFSAGSPVVPAYLHAFLHADAVYRKARETLRQNIEMFYKATVALKLFDTLPDFPVFYTPRNDLHAYLESENILISSFPYPSAGDRPVTRVVLNSRHTRQDIERLVQALRKFA